MVTRSTSSDSTTDDDNGGGGRRRQDESNDIRQYEPDGRLLYRHLADRQLISDCIDSPIDR